MTKCSICHNYHAEWRFSCPACGAIKAQGFCIDRDRNGRSVELVSAHGVVRLNEQKPYGFRRFVTADCDQ